tara:strand:+ start:1335 stop:2234 length:900 start_codon:yes stop_codon:yes gene_type:complete
MPKTFKVDKDYQDSRFDKWFKNKVIDIPHSLIEKLIRQNKVKVNKKKIKSSHRLKAGDIIDVYSIDKFKPIKKNLSLKYKPNKKELDQYDNTILEDNENFVVINKPAGIPVQSGTKSFKNIIDILKKSKYFKDSKPYIVHRIDKETSGLLIIAKNRKFAQLFTSLFRIRKIHKTYIAIVYGKVPYNSKTLKDDLISFENKKRISQNAISHLKILKSNYAYSYVELKPITGRKHQLRKQLLNIGNPIVGDDKYFIPNTRNRTHKKLLLHAYRIKFMINNIKYNFYAKYDNEFETFLKKNF